MNLVQDNAQAKAILGKVFETEFCEPCIGFLFQDENSVIHGVAILNNYAKHCSISLTFAGRSSVRPFRQISRYVFDVLRVRRVSAVVRVSNTKSQRILERLGFVQEGVLRDYFDDENGIIYGLLRQDFKLRF